MSFKIVSTTCFPQNPFPFISALQENPPENEVQDLPILGGILPNSKHIWNSKGPCLEVRNITTGHKVGSWTFGKLLRDHEVTIASVQELKRNQSSLCLLVVAVNSPLSGGQICIFDTYGSKVLRVIQLGVQIRSICVIDHGCEASGLPENSLLKYFDGVLAVGTVGATVYLMDLCKQISEDVIQNWDSNVRNELNPCPVVILQKDKLGDIKKYVQKYVDSHIALCLNEPSDSQQEYFALKGEDGENRVCVNRVEAEVSSLLYSQQLGSLLIGYNFGSFQLWDMSSVQLCYTSPICEGNIPVTHFAVQEPEDDPKSYCYIWVSYSHSLFLQPGVPYAVMYSLLFSNKRFINGLGNIYENFEHCSLRFQTELGDTETSSLASKVQGGICLGFQSVTKRPLIKDLNSMALCLVSWLFWNGDGQVNTAVLLFDLNQWYKEQMPRVPNWLHCSSYIIRYSMKEVVLDVKMDQKSLSQFMGVQRPEEHFCPTAMSFDLWGLTGSSILKIRIKGAQKAFLDSIAQDEHLALLKPDEYAEQVVSLGLEPLFCDVSLSNSTNIAYQREIILNVALEHRFLFWLCDTTTKLANGSFTAANLTVFDVLHWAFQRAVHIKTCCDKYCVPLFDYSGSKLDDNITSLIACGKGQIRTLCGFYRHVIENLGAHVNTETLAEERASLENVVVYFEVLLWMVNVGLLPEYPPSPNVTLIASAPYLVQNLTEYYNKKRAQLQLACKETFVEQDCLLFIDNLINYRGSADVLRRQWQEDGGSGLYPPPSLQSVLRTYLLDGADLNFKHSLVTYILLDIAMTLDENDKIIKLLLKFPQIFNLTLSRIKIIQAFWHLDHEDYETATQTILDSCVLPLDLQHWHHSVMMRSLLMQDHSSLALMYLEVRKPVLQEKKDLLTVLSLLISKNMLDEAFKFRQQYEGPSEHVLLNHIFEECNKNGTLHTLLHRQMDSEEENAFFRYLQNAGNSRCQDLQIYYYLQRARFLEAFDTYSSRKRKLPDSQGLIGQRDASAVDNILIMFKNLLPEVNRDLVELVRKERQTLWKEVPRPTPLSVFVHNAKEQIKYKSSVIFASLSKAKQTFNETHLNETKTEDTPFLRTPSLVKTKPRIDTPLLKSTVIQQSETGEVQEEQCGPTPCKKLKLSSRSPLNVNESLTLSRVRSVLSTPIVKRKRQSLEQVDVTTNWPHSILKSATKPLVEETRFEESTMDDVTSDARKSVGRMEFELLPRKSLRTPLKSHVKFDILRYSGSSSEDPSIRNVSILSKFSTSDPSQSQRLSKNSTVSVAGDDSIFYSPDASVSPKKAEEAKKPLSREKLDFGNDDELNKEEPETSCKAEDNMQKNFQSPKARRSYKRSFEESPTPVRSSPRIAKKPPSPEKPQNPPSSPSTPQKLRGRRSLARSVLEQNALSAVKEDRSRPFTLNEVPTSKSAFSSFSSVNSSLPDLDSSTDSSWQELYDRCMAEVETRERTREVSVVTTRRESLRRRDTGAVVEAREVVEKLETKTVEVIDDEVESMQGDERPEEQESEEEDKEEESRPKEPHEEEEELNVYDDLSSGSEDVREVLQSLNKTNLGKTYADMTSEENEGPLALNEAQMSQGFIEIGSSSEEEDKKVASPNLSPRYTPSSDRNSQSYDSSSRDSASVQVSASELSRNSTPIDEDENTQEILKQIEKAPAVDQDEDTQEVLKQISVEPAVDHDEESNEVPELIDIEGIVDQAEDALEVDGELLVESPQELPIEEAIIIQEEDISQSQNLDSDDEYMDELVLHLDEEMPDDIFEESVKTSRSSEDPLKVETQLKPSDSPEDPLQVENSVQCSVEKNEDLVKAVVQTQSVSLQCTIAQKVPEEVEEDETGVAEDLITMDDSVFVRDDAAELTPAKENEPVAEKTIVMRSVKRTYKGRKAKPDSPEDVDATPKVAPEKIKHTYSRTTRRRSRLYSQSSTSTEDTSSKSVSTGSKEVHSGLSDDVVVLDTSEKHENAGEDTKPLSVRLRRHSSRASESEKDLDEAKPGPSRISTRRSSSKSKEVVESKAVKAVRRTRSVSVDQPISVTTSIVKKRSTRSKSIDLDDTTTSGLLKSNLPPIEELPGASTDSQTSARPSSSIGDYTTSRRLTRTQASMLKSISKAEQEAHKLLEEEESGHRAESKRKNLRPRRPSADSIMSVTSEQQSDSSSPPKRAKESDQETDAKPRGRRARSASISSVKSSASVSSVRSTRSRRLAEIQEENVSNEDESSSSSIKNKRGGKKK